MQEIIEGYKVNLNNWQDKRVYVNVPQKPGHSTIGYYDLAADQFVEAKNKGTLQWCKYNLKLSEAQIIEMCKKAA